MPLVYEVTDPFHPTNNLKKTIVEVGFNTDDYIKEKHVKYHVYVNNKPIIKGHQLHENDIVLLVPKINGSVIIGIVIAVIIAAAVYFFLDRSIPTLSGIPEPDPVYTLKGQQNQIKQGEPIERHYGQVRHWPSYASRPYNRYIGQEQWLYSLLCIGVGEYIVDEVLIDDTPIANFPNAEYAIYKPGEKVKLFPTNVQTSSEVGGIELKGPNQSSYDWSGPFNVVNAGDIGYRIQIDLSFRGGLHRTNSKGKLEKRSVSATFEYRKIDNDGNPLGDWINLTNFSKNLKTVKTQRFTVSINVPDGRYQIRGKRTTNKSSDFKVRDTLHWESAKAFIETKQNFGNVTLLALKLQASNSLNDNSRNKFNVRIRSKCNVYNGTDWVLTETRNPVWAFCDILISDYGRNIAPKFLDLPTIVSLANEVQEDGIYFDGTFDSRGTIWNALTEILMSSRCRPNLTGTLISIVRDSAMSIPTICLNAHNIVPDSFKVSHGFVKANDKDGLEVEYINPVTWKRETVLCLIGNDKGVNPEKVILPGCKDRDKAYQWGLYQRASTLYQRTNVSLTTGLEGSTVTFGDLAAIQHDLLPNDFDTIPEHTGKIKESIYWDNGNTIITLPFPPVFVESEVHRIALSDNQGVMRGPYVCIKGEGNSVIIEGNLDLTLFEVNNDEEMPSYFFGVTGKEVSLFKVIGITPGSKYGEVNLNLSPYDERIYEFVGEQAPAKSNDFVIPPVTNIPIIENLNVESLDYTLEQVLVSWNPSIGASNYLIEISYNGEDYDEVNQIPSSSLVIDADPGEIWVRVAALGVINGPWSYWTGTLGMPALTELFVGSTLNIETKLDDLATEYRWKITILDNDLIEHIVISTVITVTNFLSYDSLQAQNDSDAAMIELKRNLEVTVTSVNFEGESQESFPLAVTNPLPEPVTNLTALITGSNVLFNWDSLILDLDYYSLFVSTIDGFVPSISNRITTTNSNSVEKFLGPPNTYYYIVGIKDKWGEEIIYTEQQSIIV